MSERSLRITWTDDNELGYDVDSMPWSELAAGIGFAVGNHLYVIEKANKDNADVESLVPMLLYFYTDMAKAMEKAYYERNKATVADEI